MSRGEEWLKELLQVISRGNSYEKILAQASSEYYLKSYNLRDLTPNKIINLYSYLNTKFYQNSIQHCEDSWFQNQLRIFIWVLLCYCSLKNKCISEMDQFQWNLFSSIFNNKNQHVLEFQSRFLLKCSLKSKKWTTEQANLLFSIVQEKEVKNKWNEIAKTLFLKSNKEFFRTPKQCRQHWINHLDPSKLKSSWTLNQDFELIKWVMNYGKKWSKISKQLKQKRTQHMVKNRFKSLINLQKKRISQQLQEQLLIKKVYQRLQSCQSLKQLQANKKQSKKAEASKIIEEKPAQEIEVEKVNEECSNNTSIFERQLTEGVSEWKWESEPDLQLKLIHMPTMIMDNECINYFFEDPSFITL